VPEPRSAAFLVPRSRRGTLPWMELHTTTKWDPVDVILHRGVRTCVASRAIIDLAANMPTAYALEVAIDSAIQRRRTALPRLLDRMHTMQGKGHHGCVLLRELLLDSGGESLLERRFLALMRRSRLPRPRCQATMPSAPGRRMRVDFLFGRVVVEVSGRLGHVTETDRRRDLERRNALQGQGFTVVEFTTVHVIDAPDYVVSTLRTAFSVTST
jgi:very-short-patch-repair endonuclease